MILYCIDLMGFHSVLVGKMLMGRFQSDDLGWGVDETPRLERFGTPLFISRFLVSNRL